MSIAPVYPGPDARGGLWALDFLKVLHRSGAVSDLLPSGVCLVSAVALAEHQADYLRPPNFWNGQLAQAAGLSDDEAFAACRARCVRCGWLVYLRGPARTAAGRYWVALPDGLESLIGRPLVPDQYRSDRYKTPAKTPVSTRYKTPAKTPVSTRYKTPAKTPAPPLPVPVPVPGGESACAQEATPTPPVSDRDRNRRALARTLRRAGLSASPESVSEWADLCQGLGGCDSAAAVLDCIAWVASRAAAAGIALRYARDGRELVLAWADQRRGGAA